jgi:ribosomal protein L15
MVVRKRKKFSNTRKPSKQHGKRHRGSGNRGGVGRAGVGKRGKQKKQSMSMQLGKYVLKPKNKLKTINLSDLPEGKELMLKGFKLLGRGKGVKAKVFCSAASKSAVKKIEGAGGKVEITN